MLFPTQRSLFFLLSFLVVILSTTFVAAEDKPSCLGYSKGGYTGNVTSDAECRTACETAEGLPTPDFKTSSCSGDVNGTDFQCDCKKCDSSNANCERRGLCLDQICSGGGGGAINRGMVGLAVMAAAYLLA